MNLIFANNLKLLRTKKGLNKNYAAKLFDVSPQRYAGWESGKAWPRIPVLLKICYVFNYHNLHELLTKDISKFYETTRGTE